MAHQSARNLKKRVSHLSRRVNRTELALRGMAGEVGQALTNQQQTSLATFGLVDTLIQVLEKTSPGLTDSIKALAKERADKVKAAQASPVQASPETPQAGQASG
jgi:hypothetical protein